MADLEGLKRGHWDIQQAFPGKVVKNILKVVNDKSIQRLQVFLNIVWLTLVKYETYNLIHCCRKKNKQLKYFKSWFFGINLLKNNVL